MEQLLRNLAVNQKAKILRIAGKNELTRRIRDIGLIPGTLIKVVGRAPLYDPVALKVGGSVITLRNNEADHIFVEVDQI
jgi:ferrous iron transport protein A